MLRRRDIYSEIRLQIDNYGTLPRSVGIYEYISIFMKSKTMRYSPKWVEKCGLFLN